MVNISVKELIREFESKEVDVARVNTDDGRTFSVSISLKIQENSTEQNENGKSTLQPFSVHSPIECDTSGFMNSSPDSERSGILNPPEFVDNGLCNVDDFLNFNDTTFQLESQQAIATVNDEIVNQADCESIADSDCNSADDEYFVIDELLGKRFNDKTQKYEFLLRPKRYIPKNDIIWNPIDNTDNFDLSLLEHGRLYIEVPDSLKKQERRKKSVLKDKFLSEVNLSSGTKMDYLSHGTELRNLSVCRKLDTSMVIDNGLKFDKIYSGYMCTGSTENTMDVEMGTIASNFDELVPVVPGLMDTSHQHQVTDTVMFQVPEQKPKTERESRRGEKRFYYCADCDFKVTVKRKITQHVRLHIPQPVKTNRGRRNIREKTPSINGISKNLKKACHSKTKQNGESSVGKNSSTKSKSKKRAKSNDNNENVNIDVSVKKESEEIENNSNRNGIEENLNGNCPENALDVNSDQKSENDSTTLRTNGANQTDEDSTQVSQPSEIKSETNPVCQRVMRKRKKENALAVGTKQPKFDRLSNGKVERRRRSSNIELSNDLLPQATEHIDSEDRESESCTANLTFFSIFVEKQSLVDDQSIPVSVPVTIPLRVLENSEINVETLKERLRVGDQITDESPATCSTLPSVLPSVSGCSQNISVQLLENDTITDEKIILDIINGIIDDLDPKSTTNSDNSMTENSLVDKNSTPASILSNSECESQEPILSSGSRQVSKKSRTVFKCRFCDFIAAGNAIYRKHVAQSHKDQFKQCLFCPRSFMSELSMKQHRLETHAEYLPTILLPRLNHENSSTSIS